MPIIEVHNLRKTYRLGRVRVPVLRGVDLAIEPGRSLSILGASGSGKSTLLHLLGGLDRPDRGLDRENEGGIRFEGRDLARFTARQLDEHRASAVGFVFQFYHLLPELSVLQNVAIAAMVRWRLGYAGHAPESLARARSLLEAVGLSHRMQHRPAELSGGERQRVAIARALINRPRVLLTDEPTGNLDRATGLAILDLIASQRAAEPMTWIVVTHDLEVAQRTDRTVRLVDGGIVDP